MDGGVECGLFDDEQRERGRFDISTAKSRTDGGALWLCNHRSLPALPSGGQKKCNRKGWLPYSILCSTEQQGIST